MNRNCLSILPFVPTIWKAADDGAPAEQCWTETKVGYDLIELIFGSESRARGGMGDVVGRWWWGGLEGRAHGTEEPLAKGQADA
eukprot:1224166-Pleurochrysis_carterae.AAC.1